MTQTVKTTTAPICPPKISDMNPRNTGKIAPPKIPMIIKPEISLFRDGMYNNALEKIIENIFEFPTPIKATQI